MPEEQVGQPKRRSIGSVIALVAVAILLLVLFLCAIGTIAFIFIFDKPITTRWTTAQTEMAEITKALNQYSLDHAGAYPPSLAPLTTTYFRSGVPKDPFSKSDYLYTRTSSGFTLACLGKDLAPGGAEKPDRDIIYTEAGLAE